MLKFNLDKGRVQVDPLSLTIDVLRQIHNDDTSKTKEPSNKLLTYIHLVSQLDENAPYYTSSFDEVRPLVKRQIFGDYEFSFEDDDDRIEEAIAEYQKAHESIERRAVRVFEHKIDQIRVVIEETTPVITPSSVKGVTTYASNFPLLEKMMKQIGPLMDAKDEMEARMKKERSDSGTVRGGKKLNIIEQKLSDAKRKNNQEEFTDDEELSAEDVNDF